MLGTGQVIKSVCQTCWLTSLSSGCSTCIYNQHTYFAVLKMYIWIRKIKIIFNKLLGQWYPNNFKLHTLLFLPQPSKNIFHGKPKREKDFRKIELVCKSTASKKSLTLYCNIASQSFKLKTCWWNKLVYTLYRLDIKRYFFDSTLFVILKKLFLIDQFYKHMYI